MCTVTFIPNSSDGFWLTSDRDEAPNRETLHPDRYPGDETTLLYPKDALAGGTWLGASDRPRWVCLLNGGFEAHERQLPYAMSRGKIVTQLLEAADGLSMIDQFDLSGIEPFTIVMIEGEQDKSLYELVWDGRQSHFSEKPWAPHIWSSALLYSAEARQKRQSWFSDFLFRHLTPTAAEILDFHRTAGEGDIRTNLIMDLGFVKTRSISLFCKNQQEAYLRYEDLLTKQTTVTPF